MAQPTEIFGSVKGMTRDFAVDNLPEGYLWNLVDGIPNRKGARVDIRGGWAYHGSQDYEAIPQGGYYSAFAKGQKLLVVSNSKVWDVNLSTRRRLEPRRGPADDGAERGQAERPRLLHGRGRADRAEGRHLRRHQRRGRRRCPRPPRRRRWGSPTASGSASAATPPTRPTSTSRTPRTPPPAAGPLAPWDAESWVGTNNEVTGLAGMASPDPRLPPGDDRADPRHHAAGDERRRRHVRGDAHRSGRLHPSAHDCALAREHHLRRRARRLHDRRLHRPQPDRARRHGRLLAAGVRAQDPRQPERLAAAPSSTTCW